jgi:hypothetical protein
LKNFIRLSSDHDWDEASQLEISRLSPQRVARQKTSYTVDSDDEEVIEDDDDEEDDHDENDTESSESDDDSDEELPPSRSRAKHLSSKK